MDDLTELALLPQEEAARRLHSSLEPLCHPAARQYPGLRRLAWAAAAIAPGFLNARRSPPSHPAAPTTPAQFLEALDHEALRYSVGAEARADWQPHDCRPRSAEDLLQTAGGDPAKAAQLAALEAAAFHQRSQQGFRDLYDRYDAPARQKSPRLADGLPSAWSNAYTAYWSQAARVRYQCLCAIDTFLLTIAKRQEWKARKRDIPLDTDDRSIDPASPEAGPEEQVSRQLDAATIRTAWLQQLTARERLTIELVEARELSQKAAATAMGVTEARISQLLSSANAKLSALRARFDGEIVSIANLRKAP